MKKYTTKINILFGRRITNSFSELNIPQLTLANKLYNQNKLKQAHENYERVDNILQSAQMLNSPQYLQIQKKLIGCLFLMKKYDKVITQSEKIFDLNFSKQRNYFQFSYYCSCFLRKVSPAKVYNNNVRDFTSFLLNTEEKTLKEQIKLEFPVVSGISEVLNCRSNYKQLLISLLERQKSRQIQERSLIKAHPSFQLLQAMVITFSCPDIKTESKKIIHERINEILQEYEKNMPEKVYVPLLCLTLNLIGQKNYMSAQGIIGHIKGQISNMEFKTEQDNLLTNTIYRMLVTRANNEDFEEGFKKEQRVNFGILVSERIIQSCTDLC